MEESRRTDFAPFGWSVGCAGRRAAQVREDVKTIVDWAARTCATYFPRERGYTVSAVSPAGASNGVQVTVSRGDFRAIVAVESILAPARRSRRQRAVRMYGRASSSGLAEAERVGQRQVQRFRHVGHGMGGLAFLAICWAVVGVPDPLFVLGGLFLVVAALLTLTAGGSMGAWLGEQVAQWARARAMGELDRNPFFEADLKRWKALARQLASQRHAITGQTDAPFRALPAAESRTTGSNAPVRIATSSFSFSS